MICECGGPMARWGKTDRFVKTPGVRYYCKWCRKTRTVRDGEFSVIRGRPFKVGEWRLPA